jgi:hypothetical protein
MLNRTLTAGTASAVRHTELDTPPPSPNPGIRMVARVLLWTLIGIAVVRGVLPLPSPPVRSRTFGTGFASVGSPSGGSVQDSAAMATAAAFLREYLTVDHRRSERPGRLGRYLARGVDVGDGVLPERGISQTVDLVAPAGVRRVAGGMEVPVMAHLVRTRDGTAEDAGTVSFAVPMIGGAHGAAVAGIPRPVALPVDPATMSPPVTLPTALARSVAAVAGQAVAAVLNGDRPALARLGGDVAPVVRPLPSGWRPVGIMEIRPEGPPDTPTAEVLVRATPPISGIDYLVPVRVALRPAAAATPTVREVDAGGTS